MDSQQSNHIGLDSIPIDKETIDALFSHNLISADAKKYGLRLLYPSQNWGIWISRMLLTLGVSLILSGIIFLFAFNWAKITPGIKFGTVQLALLISISASYFYGLQRPLGKIFLLSASVFVGVFLIVFSQVYQTGADAYNLFMMWDLLILPWVIISNFAALWLVWIVICNIFLGLYWSETTQSAPTNMMIFSYLALLNITFLGLREYFFTKGSDWLKERWIRIVLIIPILYYVFIPAVMFIDSPSKANLSMLFGILIAAVIHAAFYIIYSRRLPDIRAVATTLLSFCIISEYAIFKALTEIFKPSNSIMFLLMGAITLGVFTLAIAKLRAIAKEMETGNV